jgi:ketosteroid isomerase-like protein
MKRISIIVLGALVVALGQVPRMNGEDAVQQLIKVKKEWGEAEKNRDLAFLDKLYGDDLEIGTSQGDVLNKQQMLARVKDPDHKWDQIDSDHIQVRVYGNVAVMTDQTTVRGTDKGKPFGGLYRFVRVFVKRQGRWQAVLAQATPLKQ